MKKACLWLERRRFCLKTVVLVEATLLLLLERQGFCLVLERQTPLQESLLVVGEATLLLLACYWRDGRLYEKGCLLLERRRLCLLLERRQLLLYTDVVRLQAGRGTDLRMYQLEAVTYRMDVGGGLLVASIKR